MARPAMREMSPLISKAAEKAPKMRSFGHWRSAAMSMESAPSA
jgi:hypothetical protein